MATRGRKRKAGPRTKAGKLSRAYKTAVRDEGTHEFRAKRMRLINGADPQLAATASGILHANGHLTAEQHHACLRYAWCHAIIYGRPWRQVCPLGDRVGGETPDQRVVIAHAQLARMDAVLDYEQRQQVANLAVFGMWPGWFMAAKLGLRAMPEDERERQALLAGLNAIHEA
jgi:hypothetical protein